MKTRHKLADFLINMKGDIPILFMVGRRDDRLFYAEANL